MPTSELTDGSKQPHTRAPEGADPDNSGTPSGNRGPSSEALKAAALVVSTMEGLVASDRGYVLNRLSVLLFGKTARQIKRATASKDAVSGGANKPKAWRLEWRATPEYQAWQAFISLHKKDSPEQRAQHASSYDEVHKAAFRVRDTLRAAAAAKAEGNDLPSGEEPEADNPQNQEGQSGQTGEAGSGIPGTLPPANAETGK